MKLIIATVKNAGIASLRSDQLIFANGSTIRTPTTMRAGDVAADGTIPISPANGRHIKNMMAVVRLVRPVLPPAAIPAELSTYVVALLVPKRAPMLVAKLSATRALSRRLLKPEPSRAFSSSASNIPLLRPVPMNVPIESNVSERHMEKIVTITNGIFAGSV